MKEQSDWRRDHGGGGAARRGPAVRERLRRSGPVTTVLAAEPLSRGLLLRLPAEDPQHPRGPPGEAQQGGPRRPPHAAHQSPVTVSRLALPPPATLGRRLHVPVPQPRSGRPVPRPGRSGQERDGGDCEVGPQPESGGEQCAPAGRFSGKVGVSDGRLDGFTANDVFDKE